VLHLITSLDRGGAEQYLLALTRRLDRSRFQPEVAYLTGRGELVREFIQLSIPVHFIAARARIDPFALWRLTELIRERGYDLVHTHLFRADIYGALATAMTGSTPLVATRHNDDRFFLNPLVALVHYLISLRQATIIAISDHIARFTLACGVSSATKVRRVYHGLDVDLFDREAQSSAVRESLGVTDDAFLLMTVGRLTDQKGHRFLVEAMPALRAVIPGIRLVIVGEGELAAGLRTLAHKLGVADRVVFAGLRRDVPALLRSTDAFVLPSIWEGFGIVLLEAMAAHKPIIASRVSTVPEIILDQETGLLVPPGDVSALVQAVTTIERDPGRARLMGEQGRQRLEQHFSLDAMLSQTESIYAQVLSRTVRVRSIASARVP
jgi:glycosyltransferase involved in cell wall biosynthesis